MNTHPPTERNPVHRTARLLLAIVIAPTLAVLLNCTAAPPNPTPDIHSTVAAGIAATRQAERSIEAAVAGTVTAHLEQTKGTEPTYTMGLTPDIAATVTARLQAEIRPSTAANKEAKRTIVTVVAVTITARTKQPKEAKPTSTMVDQGTSETLPGPTSRGIAIAPENRCSPYDSDEYRYSPSVEPRIVAAQGGNIYSPYTGTWFKTIKETDIEHIVARSEAHDSGLCAASAATRKKFASDLLNLTLASPSVNRHQKSDKDVAEWLPRLNQCWYVDRTLQVRQKYNLTIDRREAEAAEQILAQCTTTEMLFYKR